MKVNVKVRHEEMQGNAGSPSHILNLALEDLQFLAVLQPANGPQYSPSIGLGGGGS